MSGRSSQSLAAGEGFNSPPAEVGLYTQIYNPRASDGGAFCGLTLYGHSPGCNFHVHFILVSSWLVVSLKITMETPNLFNTSVSCSCIEVTLTLFPILHILERTHGCGLALQYYITVRWSPHSQKFQLHISLSHTRYDLNSNLTRSKADWYLYANQTKAILSSSVYGRKLQLLLHQLFFHEHANLKKCFELNWRVKCSSIDRSNVKVSHSIAAASTVRLGATPTHPSITRSQ